MNERKNYKDGSEVRLLQAALDGNKELREQLAAYAHAAWAGWTEYLFSKCSEGEDDTLVIPSPLVARWRRQINTVYGALSEEEKESDRKEATVMMAIFEKKEEAKREEPFLRNIRIELKGRKHMYGSITDIDTGKGIFCNKIELTHKAGESPLLVLYCKPSTIEYLLDGVDAAILEDEKAPSLKRWVYVIREKDTQKVIDKGFVDADNYLSAKVMAEATCKVDTMDLPKCTIELLPEMETYGRRLDDKELVLQKEGHNAQA